MSDKQKDEQKDERKVVGMFNENTDEKEESEQETDNPLSMEEVAETLRERLKKLKELVDSLSEKEDSKVIALVDIECLCDEMSTLCTDLLLADYGVVPARLF